MKTYTLTEVQELLRQQRIICAKAITEKHGFGYDYPILEAPSPLLPTEEVGIKEDELHCRLDEQQCQQECEHKDNRRKCQYVIVVTKEDDYVPSDNNNDEASVASHSCTIGNSIQK